MNTEDIAELRDNINELEQLIGGGGAVSIVFEANTGEVALLNNSNYLKIREIIKLRAEQEPKLALSAERALQLVDNIDEAMARYIQTFGKFPPEFQIQ